MSVINQNLLLTPEGYQISRSVRLRSSASAYFNRTPASAGNRKTWTWSGWVKRGALSTNQTLFSCIFAANNNSTFHISIEGDNLLKVGLATLYVVTTTQVFRDPSAWYHVVFAYDSTQATSTNRWKLYINGAAVTAFSAAVYPNQNDDWAVNAAQSHDIGRLSGYAYNFDGYLTEVNFIDGQALTPSSFGETDTITGVWKPKKYAGTYGTNGFYLNFSDNSAATAAAIGKDSSGNGNNWTPNNISVTAGATYDSMLDVPTPYADGGNGRGNYCVVSPIDQFINLTGVISDGNLKFTSSSSAGVDSATSGTVGSSSGSWYFEWQIAQGSPDTNAQVGVLQTHTNTSFGSYSCTLNFYTNGTTSSTVKNGSASQTGLTACAVNDVIGVAFDATNGTMQFYRNGSAYGSQVTGLTAGNYLPLVYAQTASTGTRWILNANFGQRPFAYTPPTGFKALNTQNLPDATIKKGNAYFDVSLWTGNGSSQTITGVGFKPDLLWIKERSSTSSHCLWNSAVGVSKYLSSNETSAEYTTTTELSSINSDGFSVGSSGATNQSSQTYAAWQWKESASAGFDIVTYTGTGANRTVAHSLGVTPSMIIVKNRSALENWIVYHRSFTSADSFLRLNITDAVASGASVWNSTYPTSSVFSVGTNTATNANTQNLVAYLFAEVAGFSKFGSYTGNGSTDGPFVYCGFRPRYVMVKRTDAAGDWAMIDTARNGYNSANPYLFANLSNSEYTTTGAFEFDITANGFKVRNTGNSANTSGGTYIYAAFAENPFKNSLAR